MYSKEQILQAARAVRPYLETLLSAPRAKELDDRLAEVLAQAHAGEDVEVDLIKVMSDSVELNRWTTEFLHEEMPGVTFRTGGIGETPVQPIGVTRYACPEGDDYDWFRLSVADTVPRCPSHDVELVPVEH